MHIRRARLSAENSTDARCFCLTLSSPIPVEGESFTLNGLECTFDEQSGALLRLTHPAVGTILETSPGMAGLLNVTYSGKILEPRDPSPR